MVDSFMLYTRGGNRVPNVAVLVCTGEPNMVILVWGTRVPNLVDFCHNRVYPPDTPRVWISAA